MGLVDVDALFVADDSVHEIRVFFVTKPNSEHQFRTVFLVIYRFFARHFVEFNSLGVLTTLEKNASEQVQCSYAVFATEFFSEYFSGQLFASF